MGWAQWVVVGWMAFECGAVVARNGQPKDGVHSGFASVICSALLFWLLYMGGFFKG